MSVSLNRGTTIGRLRLRAAAADPNALRMRGGTVLGALDLQPPSLPEQSILCIRTLRDPMPGAVDLRSSSAPRPAAWEAAMRSAVGDAMRSAARPALGPVPASAAAVLFADRSELLACAARDALGGTLAIHWWWTHLLGGERSFAAVVREWMRAPAYVPAAAELLASRHEIAAFARAIAPAEAVRIIEAVLRAHALPALAFDVVNILTTELATIETRPPTAEQRYVSPTDSRAEPRLAAPWRHLIPDHTPARLTIEQQTFIAIAVVLRAPALARTARFAQEIVAWIDSVRRSEAMRDAPILPRPGEPAASETRHGTEARREPQEARAPDRGRRMQPPQDDVREAERGDSTAAKRTTEAPTIEARTTATPAPVEMHSDAASEVVTKAPHQPTPPTADEAAPPSAPPELVAPPNEIEPTALPQPGIAIDSGFAGVFFLLNVAIALGLYSDFTSPEQHGIDLDVWDFLALMGRKLGDEGKGTRDEGRESGDIPVGDSDRTSEIGSSLVPRPSSPFSRPSSLQSDPLWPLLATLANRKEGEDPGATFVPPGGQKLSDWVEATADRVTSRLALAGIDDASLVIRRYGRIVTTPAHLDVHFLLAAHPIEIRLAGLDRNPGWIPAAGRHVAFHFD